MKVFLPQAGLDGDYQLVVQIDSGDVVGEVMGTQSLEDNNEAATAVSSPINVAPGFFDLTGAVGAEVSLPSQVVAGDGTKVRLPLEVTNNGNLPIPANTNIAVHVVARPLAGGADVDVATIDGISIGGLASGQTLPLVVKVFLPQGGLDGEYQLVAEMDSSNVVNESLEDNNEAATAVSSPINVAPGFFDLTGAVGAEVSLPSQVVAGDGTKVRLPLEVTNNGNLPIPANTNIAVHVVARPLAGGADVDVATIDGISIGGLASGQTLPLVVKVFLPQGGLDGEYQLVAEMDSSNVVNESLEDNNEAATAVSSPINVAPGFFDLTGAVGAEVSLPSQVVAGDGTKVRLPLEVTNNGNLPIPANTNIAVHVVARPLAGGADVDVATIDGISIGGLASGQTLPLVVKVFLPQGGLDGEYQLVAEMDSSDVVNESLEDNNEAATAVSSPINVAPGFFDLTGAVGAEVSLPSQVVAGDGTKVRLPLEVTNNGNLPIPANTNIAVHVVARPLAGGADVDVATIDGISIGGLASGQTLPLVVKVFLPQGGLDGEYQLVAEMDSSDVVNESLEDNNEAATAVSSPINVAPGFFDLTGAVGAEVSLPSQVVAGDGTKVRLPLEVTNNGNLPIPANTNIAVHVVARPLAGGADVDVATIDGISIGGLASGQTLPLVVKVFLPQGGLDGEYQLVAEMDSSNVVNESLEDNNEAATAVSSPINVAPGFFDLTGAVGAEVSLPSQVVAGDGTKVRLPLEVTNNGNLPIPANTNIAVHVVARPLAGGADVDVATIDGISIGGLASGQTLPLVVKVFLPQGGLDGEYQLVAEMDSSNVVNESLEDNNEAATAVSSPINVAPGFFDLTGAVGAEVSLPSQVVAGDGTKVRLPLEVTNNGNLPIPANTNIAVHVVARPLAGGADVDVATIDGISIGGLASGQTLPLVVKVFLPQGGLDGEYQLVAEMDSSNVVNESLEDNNEAATAVSSPINVAPGFFDLTGAVGAEVSLPSQVVAGDGTKVRLPLEVTNNGNLPIPANTNIAVHVVARPLAGGADVDVATIDGISIGGLASGQTLPLVVKVFLPQGGLDGEYQLVAEMDSSNVVNESLEDNNEAATAVNQAISVDPGFFDLTSTIASTLDLPNQVVSGSSTSIKIPLDVKNEGNLPIAPGTQITLSAEAQEVDAQGNALSGVAPIALDTVNNENLSIGGLLPGETMRFKIRVTLPQGGLDGTYRLVVHSDSTDLVSESLRGTSLEDNNEAMTASDDLISVDPGFIDLTSTIASTLDLPNQVVSGSSTSIKIPLDVKNEGNLPITPGTQITLSAEAQEVDAQGNALPGVVPVALDTVNNENLSIGGLLPGETMRFKIRVTLPQNGLDGTYRLVVHTDSTGVVSESLRGTSLEDNNETMTASDDLISVDPGFIDLTGVISDSVSLPSLLLVEDGSKIIVPLDITNNGNLPIPNGNIGVHLVAIRESDGQEFHLGTIGNVSVGGLGPGETAHFDLSFLNGARDLDGDYQIVVRIDPNNEIVEMLRGVSLEDNNDAAAPVDQSITFVNNDFMQLTQFNDPTKTKQYVASVSTESFDGTTEVESGIVTFDIASLAPPNMDVFELSMSSPTVSTFDNSTFRWQDATRGTILVGFSDESEDGTMSVAEIDDLQIEPADPQGFRLDQTHVDKVDVTLVFDQLLETTNAEFNGNVTVNSTLLGYENDLTVPLLGSFDVAVIKTKFIYTLIGRVETADGFSGLVALKVVESFTWYASSEVGVVRIDYNASATTPGVDESISETASFKLINVLG